MAGSGKNQETDTLLKEIYNESKSEKNTGFRNSVKGFFGNSAKIDRLLAGSILFFGLAALVLGFFQLKFRIASYFFPKESPSITLDSSSLNSLSEEDLLGLRLKDTDLDGLSELNVYRTSPYLKDSDSDGKSDSDEIAAQTDPNCAPGQNCTDVNLNIGSSSDDATDNLLLSGQLQGSQIRELLLQAGASEAEIGQLSDDELLKLYNEVVAESQGGVNQQPNTISLPVGQVEDLTPDQIRQLLLEEGIDQNVLNNISDAELLDLVKETLTTF